MHSYTLQHSFIGTLFMIWPQLLSDIAVEASYQDGETNEVIIFHSITRFSSLIPHSAGINSGVLLYAVKAGHT